MIKQLSVIIEADPAIEQITAARNTLGIDIPNRTDHEVKREPKLGAKLGQHPENARSHIFKFVGAKIHTVNGLADGRHSAGATLDAEQSPAAN